MIGSKPKHRLYPQREAPLWPRIESTEDMEKEAIPIKQRQRKSKRQCRHLSSIADFLRIELYFVLSGRPLQDYLSDCMYVQLCVKSLNQLMIQHTVGFPFIILSRFLSRFLHRISSGNTSGNASWKFIQDSTQDYSGFFPQVYPRFYREISAI